MSSSAKGADGLVLKHEEGTGTSVAGLSTSVSKPDEGVVPPRGKVRQGCGCGIRPACPCDAQKSHERRKKRARRDDGLELAGSLVASFSVSSLEGDIRDATSIFAGPKHFRFVVV